MQTWNLHHDVSSTMGIMHKTRRWWRFCLASTPRVMRPWRIAFICTFLYCLLLTHRRYDFLQETDELRIKALQLEIKGRATKVRARCIAHPPPLTWMEKNARDAASLSTHMAAHYGNLHMKGALVHMVYLPRRNFTWCLVPKVASSSWARALMKVEGVRKKDSPNISPQVYLRNAYRVEPQRVNETIGPSLKFLFVRHPFERLVSAFRNKLEDSHAEEDGAYFYKIYGRRIVERFRKSSRNNVGSEDANSLNTEGEYKREPTFKEFVDYLLNTDPADYDEHWRSVALHCHVCLFDFDYIIKYENFAEEISFLVRTLQEDGRLPRGFHLNWENKGGTDKDTTVTYLKQLSEEQVAGLIEKYYLDFLYFGYSTQGYTIQPFNNEEVKNE